MNLIIHYTCGAKLVKDSSMESTATMRPAPVADIDVRASATFAAQNLGYLTCKCSLAEPDRLGGGKRSGQLTLSVLF